MNEGVLISIKDPPEPEDDLQRPLCEWKRPPAKKLTNSDPQIPRQLATERDLHILEKMSCTESSPIPGTVWIPRSPDASQ
ncbi:Hypothetical predicted protein [Marmota monax]|uniref:Uncharacterized protein n=1 Tax=Marmota monax TaxID=9995 RepID=A0A5E4D2Y4_MARMO|nr:Hypothetical predicted protein [Marmota monax]